MHAHSECVALQTVGRKSVELFYSCITVIQFPFTIGHESIYIYIYTHRYVVG